MKTFFQYIIEFSQEYFQKLPPADPPADVLKCAEKFGLSGIIHWKWLKNKSFTHSYDVGDGLIAMRPDDINENWWHEVGHVVYDYSDQTLIIPLLDRIRDTYRAKSDGPSDELKYIQLGGWRYSYSHSGKEYEHDEIFAISFAFIYGDAGKFPDTDIQNDWDAMTDRLQKTGPVKNKNQC